MSNKTKFRTILLVSLVCILSAGSVFAQLKVGYIDSQRILTTYQSAVNVQKILEGESAKAAEDLQKMESDFQQKQAALEQQNLLLSDEKKQEKTQELQNLLLEIQQFQQEKQTELAQRQEELLKPVYDKINAAINKIGEDEGFDFILNTASGSLLYAQDKYDLTDKVLAALK